MERLSKKDVLKYKSITPPFGEIGYIVYKRTYSRPVASGKRTEEWWETILRVVNGTNEVGCGFTKEELLELYDHLFWMRGMVAGRALWILGTDFISKRKTVDALYNCWGVAIDSTKAWQFMFNQLMLGGGVGFSVLQEHISKLPQLVEKKPVITRKDANDSDYIVPDSREGWISLLRRVLKSYFQTGRSFTYSLHCLRSAGAPIKGFGGTSSGPEHLELMVKNLQSVLDKKLGKKLSSVDCLDISNILGMLVKSGNVRRSALLCMGDINDSEYLYAKRWDLKDYPAWRAMSNNSVHCTEIPDEKHLLWEGYHGNGEPYGLINLGLARRKGRLIDTDRDDSMVIGTNPCVPGWSLVLTEHGIKPVEFLEIGERIYTRGGFCHVIDKIPQGIKDVYKFIFDTGVFFGTLDHKLVTSKGKMPAKEAEDCLTLECDTFDNPFLQKITKGNEIDFAKYEELFLKIFISFLTGPSANMMELPETIMSTLSLLGTKSKYVQLSHTIYVNNIQVANLLQNSTTIRSQLEAMNGGRKLRFEYCSNESFGKNRKIGMIHIGKYNVYDITVSSSLHSFWQYGLEIGNCGEIFLESYEPCNLCELFLPNLRNLKEAKRVAEMLFRVNKTISSGEFGYKETEAVVHKNMRVGVSITGWLQKHNFGIKELDELYKHLREYDKKLSKEKGWPTSIKITTVQPSGTKSLIPGVTQGAHPAFSEYYIRRIRMSAGDPLVELCKAMGYPVEPQILGSKVDHTTAVVSFPVKAPQGARLAKYMTAIDQLEEIKKLQTYWSDNSVSITVYYKKEELPAIQDWLRKNYKENIKSVSFLLHQDHGFLQAPMEEISKEQYEQLKSKVKPITKIKFNTMVEDEELSDGCEGGICPVR